MVKSDLTTVCARDGLPVRAQFTVESAGGGMSVVVESRGGSIGAQNERNSQYNLGIDLILARLAENGCIIEDAVIDTKATQRMGLSREKRRLLVDWLPIDLSTVDLPTLRTSLCAAQRTIGRVPGAKGSGNNTKRMRLYVSGLPSSVEAAVSILSRRPISSTSDESISPFVRPLRKSPRQGRGLNVQERRMVELRAMEVVREYLMKSWTSVEDVSAVGSCDFICCSGKEKIFVEVKGTTGSGGEVIVTRNEVALARTQEPNTMLAVVHSIDLLRESDHPPAATGGVLFVLSPWVPSEEDLEPLAYNYKVDAKEPT